jgi:hypothetical protein
MSAKRADKRTPEERREDALRPCGALGYDRDSFAVYFIERGAFALAEGQLKQAIWYTEPFRAGIQEPSGLVLLPAGQIAGSAGMGAEVARSEG